MVGLDMLWLPILVSSAVVFVVSSAMHMMLPWHKKDYRRVPREDEVLDALRAFSIPPGDYMAPQAANMQEMRSPEFAEKLKKGPAIVFTLMKNASPSMAKSLVLWFLYLAVVGIFSAYVAGRALPGGAEFRQVFRFAGTTAFVGYALALWPMSIWYRRSWVTTLKETVDGLVYALFTAAVFGWLWPR
jgi:hypothetical protein